MLKAGDPRSNDTRWLGQSVHVAVAEVADKRADRTLIEAALTRVRVADSSSAMISRADSAGGIRTGLVERSQPLQITDDQLIVGRVSDIDARAIALTIAPHLR
jgi:hypothetical protein